MKVSFLSGVLALALLALLVYAQDVHEEAAITSTEEAEVVAESFDGSNWSVLKESSLEDEDEESLDKRAVHACWKDSEPRGKGKSPDKETRACPENLEKSMGLCYPKCGDKRVGFGPLCIDNCATTAFKSSGAFFCCESDEVCADLMREAAMKVPRAMVKLLIDVATHPNDVRKITQDFRQVVAEAMNLRLPLCSRLPPPSLDFDASEVLSEQAEIENAPVAAETESEEGEEHKVEEKQIQESAEIM